MNDARSAFEAAFRATRYEVELPAGRVTLRVGETAPPTLDAWLAPKARHDWCVLTADNPRGRPLTRQANDSRRQALSERLAGLPYSRLPTRHCAEPPGSWPDEAGVLIAGLPVADALGLARACEQLAILVGGVRKPVELCWITYD